MTTTTKALSRRNVTAAMSDIHARDRFLAEHINDALAVEALRLVAKDSTVDQVAANAAAVAGMIAYRTGDRSMAKAMLGTALMVDHDHRLAALARTAISLGLPRAELDSLTDIL